MRISEPLPVAMNVWLLTHPDVRGNARVRALLQHIAERTPPLLAQLLCDGRTCDRVVAPPEATKPRRGRRGAV